MEDWNLKYLVCHEVIRNRGFVYFMANGRQGSAFARVASGRIIYSLKDGEQILEEGEAVFLPTGIRYEAEYDADNTKIQIVSFAFSDPKVSVRPFEKLSRVNADRIKSWFFESGVTSGNHTLYERYRLYELLWCLSESSEKSEEYQRLFPAIRDMEQNLSQNRKISEYAAMCNISEPHFRRLFSACMGSSPVDYHNRMRLERANQLLKTGDYSVEEVCRAFGFSNLSFFYRCYKKQYGTTPRGKT